MAATRVVNLRHNQPYDVYVGRAGHGLDGYYGNPYPVGHVCPRCGELHETAATTLPCFEKYFLERLSTDAEFRVRVRGLTGKILGCFCLPSACHGTVIADWLNQPAETIDIALNTLITERSR
jgi:hypothetical protein